MTVSPERMFNNGGIIVDNTDFPVHDFLFLSEDLISSGNSPMNLELFAIKLNNCF